MLTNLEALKNPDYAALSAKGTKARLTIFDKAIAEAEDLSSDWDMAAAARVIIRVLDEIRDSIETDSSEAVSTGYDNLRKSALILFKAAIKRETSILEFDR